MATNLKWRSKFFSSDYEIFDEVKQVGSLKIKSFSSKTLGIFNSIRVMFRSKGFLKQYIEILDEKTGEVVGMITFNNFMSKAKIIINGNSYNWKYTNAWNTKWHVSSGNVIDIEYKSSNSKGEIRSSSEDDLLLIAGLYIHIYYVRTMAVVMIAVLLPTWISFFNN